MEISNSNEPDDNLLFCSLEYKGTEISIGDLSVYTVGSGPKCIIFAYDIYGSHGSRTRFICDYIAANGYTVYLPDFFRNTAWDASKPLNDDFYFWIKLHNKYNINEDIFSKLMPYAENHGAKSFAIVGVHWGAFVVLNACSNVKFSCGVSIDPAAQLGVEFYQQEIDLYGSVKCPQMIITADDIHTIDKYKEGAFHVLKDRLGDDFLIQRISNTKYGYFSTQRIDDEAGRKAIKDTLSSLLKFIANTFSKIN